MNGYPDTNDGELMKAFTQRNDEAAFTAVVNRHASMVVRVCQGILGDAHEAQDAAQAVFLVLAGKASRFGNDVTVAPWLHRVAHDVAVDAVRRRQCRRLREEEGAKMMITSPDVQDAHTEEQIRWLHEQIGKLPERYRAPVVLCYLDGQSCKRARLAVRMGGRLCTFGQERKARIPGRA